MLLPLCMFQYSAMHILLHFLKELSMFIIVRFLFCIILFLGLFVCLFLETVCKFFLHCLSLMLKGIGSILYMLTHVLVCIVVTWFFLFFFSWRLFTAVGWCVHNGSALYCECMIIDLQCYPVHPATKTTTIYRVAFNVKLRFCPFFCSFTVINFTSYIVTFFYFFFLVCCMIPISMFVYAMESCKRKKNRPNAGVT